jgi:hypothetical protein
MPLQKSMSFLYSKSRNGFQIIAALFWTSRNSERKSKERKKERKKKVPPKCKHGGTFLV